MRRGPSGSNDLRALAFATVLATAIDPANCLSESAEKGAHVCSKQRERTATTLEFPCTVDGASVCAEEMTMIQPHLTDSQIGYNGGYGSYLTATPCDVDMDSDTSDIWDSVDESSSGQIELSSGTSFEVDLSTGDQDTSLRNDEFDTED